MKLKVDDKTKIQLLKAALIGSGMVTMIISTTGQVVLNAYNKRERQIAIAQRMLNRFIELSPPEVSTQIMHEFEFEWVTKDLELPKFPKEK